MRSNVGSSAVLGLLAVAVALSACERKKTSTPGHLPVTLTLPEAPAQISLLGETMQPFAASLRVEVSGKVLWSGSLLSTSEIDLEVPVGVPVKVRGWYLGISVPAGMTVASQCPKDKSASSAGPTPTPFGTPYGSPTAGYTPYPSGTSYPDKLSLDGGGPPLMYVSEVVLDAVPSGDALAIAFPAAVATKFVRMGLTVRGSQGEPAVGARLMPLDTLTGKPLETPCPPEGLQNVADSRGRVAMDFPALLANGQFGFQASYGSLTRNFGFQISTTNLLQNFLTLDLATGTSAVEAETSDFDGDGLTNGAEVRVNSNPFRNVTPDQIQAHVGMDGSGVARIWVYAYDMDSRGFQCALDGRAAAPCGGESGLCVADGKGGCLPLSEGKHVVVVSGTDGDGFALPAVTREVYWSPYYPPTGTPLPGTTQGPWPTPTPMALSVGMEAPGNRTGVSPNTNIQLWSMGDRVDPASLAGGLVLEKKSAPGVAIPCTIVAGGQKESHFGCTPVSELQESTTYVVRAKSSIKSMSGMTLGQEMVWEFTTGVADGKPPTVVFAWPGQNGDPFLAVDSVVGMGFKFSKPVRWDLFSLPGAVKIREFGVAGETALPCSLRDFEWDNHTESELNCWPATGALKPATRYEVRIVPPSGGADNGNRPLSGVLSQTFVTRGLAIESVPPTLVGLYPNIGESVRPDHVFTAVFDEPVESRDWKALRIVNAQTLAPVDADCNVLGRIVTCAPFMPLIAGDYRIDFGPIVDRQGNAFVPPVQTPWTFSVADSGNLSDFRLLYWVVAGGVESQINGIQRTDVPALAGLPVMAVFNRSVDGSSLWNGSAFALQTTFSGMSGYCEVRKSDGSDGNCPVQSYLGERVLVQRLGPALRPGATIALSLWASVRSKDGMTIATPPGHVFSVANQTPLQVLAVTPQRNELAPLGAPIRVWFNRPLFVGDTWLSTADQTYLNTNLRVTSNGQPVGCSWSVSSSFAAEGYWVGCTPQTSLGSNATVVISIGQAVDGDFVGMNFSSSFLASTATEAFAIRRVSPQGEFVGTGPVTFEVVTNRAPSVLGQIRLCDEGNTASCQFCSGYVATGPDVSPFEKRTRYTCSTVQEGRAYWAEVTGMSEVGVAADPVKWWVRSQVLPGNIRAEIPVTPWGQQQPRYIVNLWSPLRCETGVLNVPNVSTQLRWLNNGADLLWSDPVLPRGRFRPSDHITCEISFRQGGNTLAIKSVHVTIPNANADFNGDGISDLFLQSKSATLPSRVLHLDSSFRVSSQAQTLSPYSSGVPTLTMSTDWYLVGTGDMDGDARPDLVWYSETAMFPCMWFGATPNAAGSYDWNAENKCLTGFSSGSSSWKAVGLADFTGDGRPDIVAYNTSTRDVVVWGMNGDSVSMYTVATNQPVSLAPIGAGDVDGNGMADIVLWDDVSGQISIWYMNGTSVIGSSNPGPVPTALRMAAVGNYLFNSPGDLVWHDQASGGTGNIVLYSTSGGSGWTPRTLVDLNSLPIAIPWGDYLVRGP